MSEPTKACNLHVAEIQALLDHHGRQLFDNTDERVERIKYLNTRLKSFKEVEIIPEPKKESTW